MFLASLTRFLPPKAAHLFPGQIARLRGVSASRIGILHDLKDLNLSQDGGQWLYNNV